MRLSKIVGYLNHLDTLSVDSAAQDTVAELDKISYIVQNSRVQLSELTDKLVATQTQIALNLQQYEQTLHKIRQGVHELIEQSEPEYFAASTELYRSMQYETPEYILQRVQNIDPVKKEMLRSRLQTYTDWKYPGLIIRPAHSPWVEDLVALDPLYFVDTHADLIAPVDGQYTPEYQRRIRRYVIEEYNSTPWFEQLPQQQFGVVYGYGYFCFKPMEVIRQYLLEVFGLLRAGGAFLFNFNDCDRQGGVGLTEHHFCCYTPGRLIRKYAQEVGYEIVREEYIDAATTWLELKKPGVMTSIRGGQTVASIFRKLDLSQVAATYTEPSVVDTQPEEVDISVKQIYNSLDLAQLIGLANILSIDITDAKTKGMFNIKKVRRTVNQFLEEQNLPEEKLRRLFNKRNL